MHLTAQLRLYNLPNDTRLRFDALGAYHGKLLRKLYAWMAKRGGKALSHKTDFCRAYRVSSRFTNALCIELQGLIDSTAELLKSRQVDLITEIRSQRRKIAKLDKNFADIGANCLRVSTKTFTKWRTQKGKAERKLNQLQHKLGVVERRLAANVPGICFGSRKLFKKQYFLEENGYTSHREWLVDWQAARSHQCFFTGSKDETGGNLQCSMFANPDGSFNLRIRMPDALLSPNESQYILLENLMLPHDHEALMAAYATGQALTWRMHRDQKGWRLLVTWDRPAAKIITVSRHYGVVAVDFNIDHLAVTETDLYGNPTLTKRFNYGGETSGQRAASLSDALEAAVVWAQVAKKPLAVEDLDFKNKKKQLSQMSAAQARVLSGLAYARYQTLAASKCHRRGVELIKVNPSHTSVAGRVKYAKPRGWSVHQAAAGAIARRAQGYTERLPRAKEVDLPALGATLRFPVPERKAGEKEGVSWRKLGVVLKGFLRKQYLATRTSKEAQSAKGRNCRRGIALKTPSGAAVCPATISSHSLNEQICICCN